MWRDTTGHAIRSFVAVSLYAFEGYNCDFCRAIVWHADFRLLNDDEQTIWNVWLSIFDRVDYPSYEFNCLLTKKNTQSFRIFLSYSALELRELETLLEDFRVRFICMFHGKRSIEVSGRCGSWIEFISIDWQQFSFRISVRWATYRGRLRCWVLFTRATPPRSNQQSAKRRSCCARPIEKIGNYTHFATRYCGSIGLRAFINPSSPPSPL